MPSQGGEGQFFKGEEEQGASLVRIPHLTFADFCLKNRRPRKSGKGGEAPPAAAERENIGSGRWREDLKGFRRGREGKICRKSTLPPAHVLPMLYSPSSNRFFGERHENQGLKYICTHASSASSTGFLWQEFFPPPPSVKCRKPKSRGVREENFVVEKRRHL